MFRRIRRFVRRTVSRVTREVSTAVRNPIVQGLGAAALGATTGGLGLGASAALGLGAAAVGSNMAASNKIAEDQVKQAVKQEQSQQQAVDEAAARQAAEEKWQRDQLKLSQNIQATQNKSITDSSTNSLQDALQAAVPEDDILKKVIKRGAK